MASTFDISLSSRAQQFMDRFATFRAERNSRRRDEASAAQLQLMEPRLREDIGVAGEEEAWRQPLASLNPMVVAISLYTVPRTGR